MRRATAKRLGLHHTGSFTIRSESQVVAMRALATRIHSKSTSVYHALPATEDCCMPTKKSRQGEFTSPASMM
ncbi:MAG: hypothetical protein CMM00_11025 [Rhodopirellula sp.]|nr:hypothetical protein [Rhodopirellula sp.]